MVLAFKDSPTEAWIQELDQRYPVERTVREALHRKLRLRRGEEYRVRSAEEVERGLKTLLAEHLGDDFGIDDLKRLPGGGSKEQFTFDLTWKPDGKQVRQRMILRMNPGESLVETHRLREYQLLRAFEGVIPVPKTYWIDGDGEHLGQPALICDFVGGMTQPAEKGKANAVGVDYGAGMRATLAEQFVNILARIHERDLSECALSAFDVPREGTTEAVEWKIAWWERVYEEDALEEHPVLSRTLRWLKNNMPVCDRVSVIHGDYRSGNFLYDDDGRITAMLDWELGHLGDPHDDLSWLLMRSWGHYDEEGRFLYCGLLAYPDLVEQYSRLTGTTVNEKKLEYYRILNTFKLGVIGYSTGPRASHDGQSHQDIIVNLLTAVGHVCLADLHQSLREVEES